MHEVVHQGRILDVSAVDVHGLVELLHIGGLLQLESIQVDLGPVDDATHQPAVL